ncbi:InlB B-repeat-containing protein [Bifidobacterium longum]|nr:InlB B-repeat-containing protein [Bifidobacterium longum]MDB6593760.1 InlB B-repeat-containing protein [Bifidobacterium longum]
MRNIIRIGAGTDRRNRFVAIALGVALAAGPAAMLPAAALAAPATDAAAASTTAGTTITLQGADGASLAGHTFNVYRIGTYTDQILNGTQISSLGVRGDTASNAWAADAIGIANAYDPSTADDIAKVYGYDDAGNIANIKMDSQTRQLRNISKALGQSTRKPAAIQGGANLTTTQSTLTFNVPAEGLYYITDSAGNPIMVGTKSGNANIMKNDAKDPQWRTLGVAVVKSKSMRVDKKVQVSRNGATVGKDGTATNPVGVTVGDTVTNTVEVTVPNKQAAGAVKFKLVDQPKGQTYVQGSLSVRLKNAPQTDITADAIVYDGTTQNNAKSIPGDPALKTADNRPADPDLAIPAGGWGIDGRNLLDKYSNRTIVITYRMTVDKASITDPANNTVHTYGTFTDGVRFTTITDQDKADIKAYDFTLRKVDAGNVQTLTYHGNGATDGNTAAQSGKTGDELTTNANGFTRDGYTFVEWNTKADGTGGHYGKGTNGVAKWTMLPAGNDLYAIWQANPANIRYRDDWGATGSTPDTTGVTGQNVTIAQNGFTRPGYTFTGWARDRRTDPSLQPGGRYTLTPGTTTLWAQWKADPAHLIYNSNSGSTSQTRRTDGVVDQTLTVIANPFTRSGYTFTGWNTQADGRGKAYAAGNGFRLVADAKSNPVNTTVLYAQWRINRVALKFDPNGGTGGYPDITADAFTTVTIPADAKEPKVQWPGFRFTGWAMKPTPGNGDTILGPGKGTVAMPDQGSITVYAQWAPAMTTLPFTGGHAQVPTIGLYAGLAFMILAMGALMPVIRLRMGAGSKGRHAGTPTIGRHSR